MVTTTSFILDVAEVTDMSPDLNWIKVVYTILNHPVRYEVTIPLTDAEKQVFQTNDAQQVLPLIKQIMTANFQPLKADAHSIPPASRPGPERQWVGVKNYKADIDPSPPPPP